MLLRRSSPKFFPAPLKETAENLRNPYRGFFTLCRFWAEDAFMPEEKIPLEDYRPDPEHTLSLVEINLGRYAARPLNDAALKNTADILEHFHRLRQGVILRLMYDWEGLGAQHEPKELGLILEHLRQLSPVLHRFEADLFVCQGLLIGSWGEMHNTRYAAEGDLIRLSGAMAEATGKSTFAAVRCPNLWRMIFRSFGSIDDREAFSGSARARFGLFNDAILGSQTDLGTYGSLSFATAARPGDKLTRQDELNFQNRLCRYVPNGGEVLNGSPPADFADAVKTFELMRLTYLNGRYDRAVLDRWRNTPVQGWQSAFRGLSGYDHIAARLGYRFLIAGLTAAKAAGGASAFTLNVAVSNEGFAPCYRPLNVELVLRGPGAETRIRADSDARDWLPRQRVSIPFTVDAAALQGRYSVFLELHCAQTGREVRFANTDASNAIGEWIF